jgi:murein endopeptidase
MKKTQISLIFSLLALFSACADHPGKWQALYFQRTQPPVITEAQPEATPPSGPAKENSVGPEAVLPPVTVVRGKLDFVRKNVEMTPERIRVTGTLRKDVDADRELVLEGQPNPEVGVVELHEVSEGEQGERTEKAAGIMYCLGQGADGNYACDNFYMNLYVNDESRDQIYGDQFIIRPEEPEIRVEKPAPTAELPEINPMMPEIPEIEIPELPYLEREVFHDEPKRLRTHGYPVEEMGELTALNLLPKSKTEKFPSSNVSTTTSTTSTTTTTQPDRPLSTPPKPLVRQTPVPTPAPIPSSTSTTSTTSTTTTTLPAVPQSTTTTTTQPKLKTPPAPKATAEQAIGLHSKGWLNNPTNLLELAGKENSNFNILWPQQNWHFGTREMGSFLQALGKAVTEIAPGQTLNVGHVSRAKGGKSGHSSHQIGMDVDISYLVSEQNLVFKNVTTKSGVQEGFLIKENWELLKKAFATQMVAGVFTDSRIRKALCLHAVASGELVDADDRGEAYQVLLRTSVEPGHHDHFHIRLKCPENGKRCLVADPGVQAVKCFPPKEK